MNAYKVTMEFEKEALKYYPVCKLELEIVARTEKESVAKAERIIPIGMLHYIRDCNTEDLKLIEA